MVHAYSLNGYNIAIDGNSGSIHILDALTYELLLNAKAFEEIDTVPDDLENRYSKVEIDEAYKEISGLTEQKMLFSTEQSLVDAFETKQMDTALKSLCLNVSHDCNLRCEYCFASEGDYQSGRELMGSDVALKAVDYLVEHSGNRRSIEMDFFGGEPLMNFDVVKEVVAYARQIEKRTDKKFHFTITTNGTLLDQEKIAFINEHMNNVVISIDGRKEVHDSARHDRSGHGSYDRIMPLAKELVSGRKGKSYFIRGTFTARNKDFSNDVMHLADMGFKEISVEPVVGEGDKLYLKESDIPDVLSEYENLALKYIERLSTDRQFRFYHFNINTYKGPCLFKKVSACGAGLEYLAVSPDGKLYPCHQFVGQDAFVVGDVFTGIHNHQMGFDFRSANIFTKEKCRECWAKLFCSGGCHSNAYFSNGSIEQPNELSCILQRKRIECAVMIQAVKADLGC